MSSDLKLGKSEIILVKKYCSRVQDDDLGVLASSLPQSVVGDRSAAADILQKDKSKEKNYLRLLDAMYHQQR